MHLWRFATNILPTKLNLFRFVPNIDVNCSLCNYERESFLHSFTRCQVAQILWFVCDWGLKNVEHSILRPIRNPVGEVRPLCNLDGRICGAVEE